MGHSEGARFLWIRIVIPLTLDTYPHVLPGLGDAAAGAMDEALGWSGCSTYRPQIPLAPHFFYFEIIAFYLRIKEEAERVGFEPTRRLNTAYAISSRAPSANSDTSPGMKSLPNGGEGE
jgi:hypothetical protein